ncbi:hypothetical protein ALC57_13088 [Trachymyrmex cornetzi]|uniref:Uncharacterized protein n=1 Tax=Trachymyrmex cornetzi TaxID=471704 RepID=A0A195DQA7_9HYME|nr:hypothetical protein ALC57_13088 [Trachymyrmex cornetzi]
MYTARIIIRPFDGELGEKTREREGWLDRLSASMSLVPRNDSSRQTNFRSSRSSNRRAHFAPITATKMAMTENASERARRRELPRPLRDEFPRSQKNFLLLVLFLLFELPSRRISEGLGTHEVERGFAGNCQAGGSIMSTGFGEPITPDPNQKQSRTPRTREEQKKDEDEEERRRRRRRKRRRRSRRRAEGSIGRRGSTRGKGGREEGGSDEGEILSRYNPPDRIAPRERHSQVSSRSDNSTGLEFDIPTNLT